MKFKRLSIHPSYRSEIFQLSFFLTLLFLFLLSARLFLPVGRPLLINGYITIHIFLETISILISMMVFAFCWGMYLKDRAGNFLILSSVFFGVGFLDFFHAVSFQGMPDFITPSGAEKSIDFWLAGRFMSAAGLLFFASMPWEKTPPRSNRFLILFVILLIISLMTWIILFHQQWIPSTFQAQTGLTRFKILTEYGLIFLYILAAILFWKKLQKKQEYDIVALLAAAIVLAMSEYFFTLYQNLQDLYNLIGHIYKCIAYAFVYRAIFLDSMRIIIERLNYNEQLLAAILDTLPMGVFAKDVRDGYKFRLWNKFAEKLYALKAHEVLGKDDYDYFPLDEANWFRKKDIETVEKNEVIDIPEEIIHTKKGPVTVHTKKVVVHDHQNKPLLLLGVSENITQMKEMTANLKEAIAARDEFLIIASHELKTPMTTLKLRLQIMQRHCTFNEILMSDLKIVLKQVDRLNRLMNSILDVSRIQAGRFTLDISPVNLKETIAFVVNQFEEQLTESKCHVEMHIPDEIIRPWDQARLEQIFSNLLANSIKYAPGRRIEITASSDLLTTTVIFKDEGPGIPKEKQKLVFERFERAGASLSVSGLGLGLYICKNIVIALHGKIHLESEEGKGTTFIIELPNSTDQLLLTPPESKIPVSHLYH